MPSVGNMGVLALRGNTKGPAPQIQEEDIIGNDFYPWTHRTVSYRGVYAKIKIIF